MQHLQQKNRDAVYRLQTECEIIKVALACAGRQIPARMDRKNMDAYRKIVATIKLDVLTPEKIDDFLAALPASTSARTRNGYRTSVINLCNFLVQRRKLQFNPLLSVTRQEGEKKRKRRALTAEQLQALFDAAKVRPVEQVRLITRGQRKGQRIAKLKESTQAKLEKLGQQRSLIYATAFYSGLRRGELQQLCVKHLQLTDDTPHIDMPGTFTKNGKDAAIPIPTSLATLLQAWITDKRPDDKVFNMPKYDELLKALKKDLAFIGIPYRDGRGRVFDFHSLRKSLGTALRLAKIDPSVSRLFMRHGDIRLTMEVYNDDQLHNLAEVVNQLPQFRL